MVDKTALMADRFKVKAPELEGGDIATSAVTLLYDLNLLPTETDLNTAGVGAAAFRKPSNERRPHRGWGNGADQVVGRRRERLDPGCLGRRQTVLEFRQ